MLQALDDVGVSAVILEANAPVDMPHHRLLADALLSATGTWRRWSDTAWERNGKHFLVYRRIQTVSGPFCVEVSLEETLKRRMNFCMSGQAN